VKQDRAGRQLATRASMVVMRLSDAHAIAEFAVSGRLG